MASDRISSTPKPRGKRLVRCDRCMGKGTHWQYNGPKTYGGYIRCRACGGTGKTPAGT